MVRNWLPVGFIDALNLKALTVLQSDKTTLSGNVNSWLHDRSDIYPDTGGSRRMTNSAQSWQKVKS